MCTHRFPCQGYEHLKAFATPDIQQETFPDEALDSCHPGAQTAEWTWLEVLCPKIINAVLWLMLKQSCFSAELGSSLGESINPFFPWDEFSPPFLTAVFLLHPGVWLIFHGWFSVQTPTDRDCSLCRHMENCNGTRTTGNRGYMSGSACEISVPYLIMCFLHVPSYFTPHITIYDSQRQQILCSMIFIWLIPAKSYCLAK